MLQMIDILQELESCNCWKLKRCENNHSLFLFVAQIVFLNFFVIYRRPHNFIQFLEEDEQEIIVDAFFNKYGISGFIGAACFITTVKKLVFL